MTAPMLSQGPFKEQARITILKARTRNASYASGVLPVRGVIVLSALQVRFRRFIDCFAFGY